MGCTLYLSPWVSGTRAAAYFGPIGAHLFVVGSDEQEWFKAELDLLEQLSNIAEALGANAVVGLQVDLDPFAEKDGHKGLGLHAVGTAARLEPLWT